MKGKIIKGVGGLYSIWSENQLFNGKPRGVFRYQKTKPLVGDEVAFSLPQGGREVVIDEILPRKNALVRPAVANTDQILVEFALKEPDPSFLTLDKYLLTLGRLALPIVIAFNKLDLCERKEAEEIQRIYEKAGFIVFLVSAKTGEGIPELIAELSGKTTIYAGPSGAGKSTMINRLCPEAEAMTGELSAKIRRGKNTTRHTELFLVEGMGENTWLCDTPGFTSVWLPAMKEEDVKAYYPEFSPFAESCRFPGCLHRGEKDCGVKLAVKNQELSPVRYENYLRILEEVREAREY